jgi:formylglycine-generating enzyme required for sulfatase activity
MVVESVWHRVVEDADSLQGQMAVQKASDQVTVGVWQKQPGGKWERKDFIVWLGRQVATQKESPQPGKPWENSLGMRFVPVPGTDVLFSIWETRVRDYRAYAAANTEVDSSWQNPWYLDQKVTPTEDCPVVNVSWEDAKAFCEWLTKKERAEGKIKANQRYKLPADWEWSVAVGLIESRRGTPKEKDGKIKDEYPWGTQWPPPQGAGNYADAAAKRSFSGKRAFSSWTVIDGYDDGYATMAPVGSFAANRFGLYDLGGNVLEWCEDYYDEQLGKRVSRGASSGVGAPGLLLSSHRNGTYSAGWNSVGFRCVLKKNDSSDAANQKSSSSEPPIVSQENDVGQEPPTANPTAPATDMIDVGNDGWSSSGGTYFGGTQVGWKVRMNRSVALRSVVIESGSSLEAIRIYTSSKKLVATAKIAGTRAEFTSPVPLSTETIYYVVGFTAQTANHPRYKAFTFPARYEALDILAGVDNSPNADGFGNENEGSLWDIRAVEFTRL